MSKKWVTVEAAPGYLCTLAEQTWEPNKTEADPEGQLEARPVLRQVAHITRMHGDYALVDAFSGTVIPTWPPAAVDALIQYRASRVQGVVPPTDPADAV